MEINGIEAVSATSAMHSASSVAKSSSDFKNLDFGSEIDNDNALRRQQTREKVEDSLKELKDKLELHDNWYHVFVGEDYFKLKGDGKLTYGKLREMLGIPPKALSKSNPDKGKISDKDVIQGSIEIKFSDIGWFERRMDEMEARDVRNQRNHGNNIAGYSRAVSDSDIFEFLGK